MTNISKSNRFFLPEVTKVLWVPTIAAFATGPTRAELTASTQLQDEVASISGWSISAAMQDSPDLGKRFVTQVAGRITAAESSLVFWSSKDGIDVREVLAREDAAYIAFLDGGDVPDSPMDVFETEVASVTKLREIEGIGRIEVKFAIKNFVEDLAIPALT